MADERRGIVARVQEHVAGVRSIFLALDGPLRFLPGHFVSCKIPAGTDVLTRAYSIASDPRSEREIELLLDRVPGGPGSAHLFGLVPGDEVVFTGPWGTFVLEAQPCAETIFVADGTAIAPIRPMLHRACATGRAPLHLLYGTPAHGLLIYGDELDGLAASYDRFGWEAVPTADLEAVVEDRYVTGDAGRDRHFYVCGVGDRVRRLRRLLRGAGYARRAVLCERW